MARPGDPKVLGKVLTVQVVARAQAEVRLSAADAQAREVEAAREQARAALAKAVEDWHGGLGSPAFSPEWLGTMAARVVDRDRLDAEAQSLLDAATADRGRREHAFRVADASKSLAARAHVRARTAAARRREERRLIDRPSAEGMR